MLLLELFERKHPWKWTSKSSDRHEAKFPVHQGDIVVDFVLLHGYKPDNFWEWSFEYVPEGGEGTVYKTGLGDEFAIWATAIDIAKTFLNEEKPDGLVMSSLKREPSRVKLFDRLWNRVFGKDWNIERKERGAAVEYILTPKERRIAA